MDAYVDEVQDMEEPWERQVDHRNPTPKDIRVMPWTLEAARQMAERVDVAARFATLRRKEKTDD